MPLYSKHGTSAATLGARDASVRGTVETLLAGIEARGDAAVRKMSATFEQGDRRLCMREGFAGHAEQADVRVRRCGGRNVPCGQAAE